MSDTYGLAVDEASDYLQHPILGLRLKNITNQLLKHKDKDIVDIMGTGLDAMKLQASMTLFDYFSPNDVFGQALDVFFDGHKHQKTLDILNYVQK